MTHCDRCPLKRHRRPCPAQWDGCADACAMVDELRPEIVAARDEAAFRLRVRALADARAVELSPAVSDSSQELVVAHYREDLSWLDRVDCRAVVYTKGGRIVRGVPARSLPNIGREGHTYLHHIVTRYDSLAEWTVFTQGGTADHCPDLLERLRLRPAAPLSLAPRYKAEWPGPEVTGLDLVERFEGFDIRYGNAAVYGGETIGTGKHAWLGRAWRAVFACAPPRPWWYGYGAIWSVPRASILARPLSFWRALLDLVAGSGGLARHPTDRWDTHPINAWSMEALWYYLFADPSVYPHRLGVPSGTFAPNQGAQGRAVMRLARRASSCPHRGCKVGCQSAECTAGYGDRRDGREATMQHCLSCPHNPLPPLDTSS